MRSTDAMMLGSVLGLCGSILNLTSVNSPNWRTVCNISGEDPGLVLQQGLWDVCWDVIQKGQTDLLCTRDYRGYLESQIVTVAKWMTLGSFPVTLSGLAVALGAHASLDRQRCLVSSFGGLLVACSGLLIIIPAAWFAHIFTDLPSPSTNIRLGHSVVLACIGGAMEVMSGITIFVGNCVTCNVLKQTQRRKSSARCIPGTFRGDNTQSDNVLIKDSMDYDDQL